MTTTLRSPRRLSTLCGRTLLGLAIFELAAIVVFRTGWRPALDLIRGFNRRVLNPVMMKAAGRRHWYASVVHHVGRSTGRGYSTPVWALEVGRFVFIPLPYGIDVDWCRNVLTAGACALDVHGARIHGGRPEIVPAAHAAPQLPWRARIRFGVFGVESYLRLEISNDPHLVDLAV